MLAGDLLEESKSILGVCDEADVYKKMTRAITVLANKGYWNPMQGVLNICACSDGRTVTLPRDVEVPLAVNTNGVPGFFRNRWFEYHLNGPGSDNSLRGTVGCNWNWDDRGDVPTFMDIIKPSYLTVIAQLQNDLDKQIRIFGLDSNRQWIRSQEADGSWMDGFVPPTNLITDFPQSLIIPDSTRLFKRIFTAGTINTFTSSTPHNLTTGAEVLLTLIVAPIPDPLISGQYYFVRVINSTTVKLYNTRTDALTDQNVIQITSSSPASVISLEDDRQAFVETQFTSGSDMKIATGTRVQFTGSPLPSPLVAGTNYYVGVQNSTNVVIYATQSDAINGVNPVYVTTPGTTVVMTAKLATNPITDFVFSVPHDFLTGDTLVASTTGVLPTGLDTGIDYFSRKLDTYTITLHNTVADAVNNVNPILVFDTGSGTHSLIKTMNATASTGTANNITAVGNNLETGAFISFQTTGTLPTPIAANTVYQTGAPSSANTFSLFTTAPAAVNITAVGTGQLKLVISRAFSVGFTSEWTLDASLLATQDAVRVASTGTLPLADPVLSTGTDYYLRVLTASKVALYDTAAHAADLQIRNTTLRERTSNVSTLTTSIAHNLTTGDLVDISGMSDSTYNGLNQSVTVTSATEFEYANTGPDEGSTGDTGGIVVISDIKVLDFGTGSLTIDRLISVAANPLSSNLTLSDASYLTTGVTVRFKTDGTLPAPLSTGIDYTLVIQSATEISLLSAGSPVVLSTVGSGNHTMFILANFGVVPANNFTVLQNEYNNGDAVTTLQGTDSTLPSPLLNNTVYYVRRIDNNTVELYDTYANAIASPAITGRINPGTSGSGTNYFTQILSNFLVSQVDRVLKDQSIGFMEVWANDTGRTNSLTKIGFYYPDETQPSYRRISVSSCCSWVRMRYKRRTFTITAATDWIPLNSAMAIIYMIRAFKLYEDNFFDDAKKYELQAEQWLTEEQANNSGPDSVVIQIDSGISMNTESQWMT